MPLTKTLLQQLRNDHSHYQFEADKDYKWSSSKQIITFNPLTVEQPEGEAYLLHELAHASLGHKDYVFDIELIRQEAEAWEYAEKTLAPRYLRRIAEDFAQENMDTYRQWLHLRSRCPECSQTGLQTKTSTYVCLNCRCSWRVNDARQCELRRYLLL